MLPTLPNRCLIGSYNINAASVEPNWMMHISTTCYIWKSEIRLEEGIANWVTIACFYFALCYECLDWIIWKLGLLLPAYCVDCTMHDKRVCTCNVGIPPSWVQRENSSRKSS